MSTTKTKDRYLLDRKTLARAGFTSPREYAMLRELSHQRGGMFGRGRVGALDAKLLDAYLELGLTTASDIANVYPMEPEEVSAYQSLGIETGADIARAVVSGISVAVAKQFIEAGVLDLPAMVAMKSADIGSGTLTAYRKLDDFQPDDAAKLKEAKVSAAFVNAAVKVGVKSVSDVITLASEGVKGDDIRLLGMGFTMDQVKTIAGGYRTKSGEAYAMVRDYNKVGVTDPAEILEIRYQIKPKDIEALQEIQSDIDWRAYAPAVRHFDIKTVLALIDAGASVETIAGLADLDVEDVTEWGKRVGGRFYWRTDKIKVALRVYTPDEILTMSKANPRITDLWPSSSDLRVKGFHSFAEEDLFDPERFRLCYEHNVDYSTLSHFHRSGVADPAHVIKLEEMGWGYKEVKVALDGGFTLEEVMATRWAKPEHKRSRRGWNSIAIYEEPDSIDPEEDENEESGSKVHGPDDWEWDD